MVIGPHTRHTIQGWESWSLNGEVWIDEKIPTAPGSKKMAEYLTWVVREYASAARRVHKGCGTLPFVFDRATRTPPTIAWAFHMWFDLALMDRCLIEVRVRQLGWELPEGDWPGYWVERDGLTLVADATEVKVDAASAPVAPALTDAWATSLERVTRAQAAAMGQSIAEAGFVASFVVAVHEQREPSRRPSRTQSLERHLDVLAALEPATRRYDLPVTWHAAWRLPPGLKITMGGEEPWLRFPAVSFVAAVHAHADQ